MVLLHDEILVLLLALILGLCLRVPVGMHMRARGRVRVCMCTCACAYMASENQALAKNYQSTVVSRPTLVLSSIGVT